VTFRVGQKVVCVRDGYFVNKCVHRPIVGHVYTVRDVFISPRSAEYGPAIRVFELLNPIHKGSGREYGFYASRFRPVFEGKTDIGCFTEILTKLPEKV
jgi:hypothetical protein